MCHYGSPGCADTTDAEHTCRPAPAPAPAAADPREQLGRISAVLATTSREAPHYYQAMAYRRIHDILGTSTTEPRA